MKHHLRRVLRALAATTMLGGIALVAPATAAVAADNPFERGPAPSESSIEALRGPFSTSSTNVSRFVSGFGGGTIHYPTTTSQGTFGAVVITPGFTASESTISWLGPRLASQGFVVMTIDTESRYDQPGSRAEQMADAMDYLTEDSSVRSRIDDDRLAFMGHSMGGGGTIEAVDDDPSIKAAIPLTPWHTQKTWRNVDTPTLVIGAEDDSVASVRSHAIPLYEGIPSGTPKAYLELRGASHFAPNTSNTDIAKYSIAWLKRWVDDDTRYSQFISPGPGTGLDYSDWRRSGY